MLPRVPRAFLALALVLAGCLPELSRTIDTTFPPFGEIEALPVRLVDRTGLAMAIEVAADEGRIEPVENQPGRPNVLIATWLGGMCDHQVTLTFESTDQGYRLTERTDRSDSCLLAGISRTVVIHLSQPVPASLVTLESAPA